jgi:hypothetical protein
MSLANILHGDLKANPFLKRIREAVEVPVTDVKSAAGLL